MRLADLVAEAGGRLATADDNRRLLEFFDTSAMQTSSFALQYRRAPDFFKLLRYQGDQSWVMYSEDETRGVRALGTISLRRAWVDGASTTVGYLGDLRIGFQRRAVRSWRRLFNKVVSHTADIDEFAGCTHWLTVVMDDNAIARRALVQARSDSPTYVPIAPFTMRNVVARLPFGRGRRNGSATWRARRATAADAERLTNFFDDEQRRTPFGFRDELPRRFGVWDALATGNFLLVEDGGRIVACAAPWSAASAKTMVVSRLPLAARALERASRVLPAGFVRLPVAGEALRVHYLTHLTFAANLPDADRLGAFRAILDAVFDERRASDWHCIAFADFASWNLGRALRGFVQQGVPITVYAVLPSGADTSAAMRWCASTPPAFEMATV